MNIKKTILCAAATATAMLMASDTPEVSNVTMTQASFGRQVTITYELNNAPNGAVVTLDVETNATGNVWASIGGEAVCNAQGAVWRKVTSADADGSGKYTITWRPDLSWEGHKIALADGGARAVVTAWALDNTPDYMVVDISAFAQPNTQKYYPAADFLPGGILGMDEYRTTKIVMRKIMAKDVEWTMGATDLEPKVDSREKTHSVMLTNNYYIGVFEVTQDQWARVQTANATPSNYKTYAMRPVENVSFIMARNAAENYTADASSPTTADDWPNPPNGNSFLGKLRTLTQIDFDLPSEAQWEFAARAGHGSCKWSDGSDFQLDSEYVDPNLARLARYNVANDSSVSLKTAEVGSYEPNSWGLYDVHGNVWEWTLDWYGGNISSLNGAVNTTPQSGKKWRIMRGGSWNEAGRHARPAMRKECEIDAVRPSAGLRLYCTAGLK